MPARVTGHLNALGRGCVKYRGTAVSNKPDAGFDYDRYRQLLAEADDESKRLDLINLLIEEKAKDSLARQSLRARLADLGLAKSRTD